MLQKRERGKEKIAFVFSFIYYNNKNIDILHKVRG